MRWRSIRVCKLPRPILQLLQRGVAARNGGNITLKSGKPSGVAINISNTGQLLSLLDAAAPGPGGKVTILATGANSSARINGTLRADRGTIDIRHTGDAGQITLGGPARATPLMRMVMSSKSRPWATTACSLSATACCRRTQP